MIILVLHLKLYIGLQKANSAYEEKLGGKHTEQTMYALSREIEELKSLQKDGRSLHTELSALCGIVATLGADLQQHNIPSKLTSLRKTLCEVIKGVTRFKREASTHICDRLWINHPYAAFCQN